ncbi:MAG: NifU family protein [Candidatus Algichlamydia australiensis]|nr:NifU family protein [Chlamydiales bacterium]
MLNWRLFSKKLKERVLQPRCYGSFSEESAKKRCMRLVQAEEKEGFIHAKLSLLVDEEDGVIADARYLCQGDPLHIAALEALCQLAIRKNVVQAGRISSKLLEHFYGEFPEEGAGQINLSLSLLDEALKFCHDIEVEGPIQTSPVENLESEGPHPEWGLLDSKGKIDLIKNVIAEEVAPYVELDAGGVEVKNLKEDREVVITYQGACVTCYAATGSTLSAIQGILRAKVHPDLVVTPDL